MNKHKIREADSLPALARRAGARVLTAANHSEPLRTAAAKLSEDYGLTAGAGSHIGDGVSIYSDDVRLGRYVRVEDDVLINHPLVAEDHVKIGHGSEIRGATTIGRHTNLVADNVIQAEANIGNFSALAYGAVLQGRSLPLHRLALQRDFQRDQLGIDHQPRDEPIHIGHDVYLGRDALVLPGRSVGTGAVVGARAVVTRDVEPYTVVGGNPARVINRRCSEETVDELLEMAWWNWSDGEIAERADLFREHIESVDVRDGSVRPEPGVVA